MTLLIEQKRKKVGLTQQQLARACGVSQSLITKVERGLIDPSYSVATKILQTLDSFAKKDEKTIGECVTVKMISCSPVTSRKKVIALMQEHAVSQIPVIEKGLCLGIVTEKDLLYKSDATAAGCMSDAPPIVSPSMRLSTAKRLLQDSAVLLIQKKGKISGIISRSDLFLQDA